MIRIDYPQQQFKIKNKDGKDYIFDECRKKWVFLSAEEWVRQNIIQFLVKSLKYPKPLIAVEKEIYINDVKKRFDIVVFKHNKPWMIIECKESNVAITNQVLTQILNYNIALKVDYLVVTNGNETHAVHVFNGEFKMLDDFPGY